MNYLVSNVENGSRFDKLSNRYHEISVFFLHKSVILRH